MTYVNMGLGVLFLCKSGFKAYDILYFVWAVSDVSFRLSQGLMCCLCVWNKLCMMQNPLADKHTRAHADTVKQDF